ncbi:MAG: hypothetical protein HQ548_08750 [Chloroflexi bacterium]|nr:hypothetical protein [Chloroflexota bacterium]
MTAYLFWAPSGLAFGVETGRVGAVLFGVGVERGPATGLGDGASAANGPRVASGAAPAARGGDAAGAGPVVVRGVGESDTAAGSVAPQPQPAVTANATARIGAIASIVRLHIEMLLISLNQRRRRSGIGAPVHIPV